MGTSEAGIVVSYRGDEDVVLWLIRLAGESPVVYPSWPSDYPARLAVCLYQTALGAMPFEILVPRTREQMLAARSPARLWFVLPAKDFCDQTDADISWFTHE